MFLHFPLDNPIALGYVSLIMLMEGHAMTTYSVSNGDGTISRMGLTSERAHTLAQALADEHGEAMTVYEHPANGDEPVEHATVHPRGIELLAHKED